MSIKTILSSSIFLLVFIGLTLAQSPADYICNEFNGSLTGPIEGRSFVGSTYKCTVKNQWDMQIQSRINSLVLEDEHFKNAKKWKETYVDNENYIRRAFSFDTGSFHIVNLYVPYEKKTDHFFIAFN